MMNRSADTAMIGDSSCQDVPLQLLEAFGRGEVAVFAGLDVSAEHREALGRHLAQCIAEEVSANAEGCELPELMEVLASRPNGRVRLIELIKEAIEKITSFEEVRSFATSFHRELATLNLVDTIVTTNWDTLFEDDCGAVPFVFSEDMPFWDVPRRRVLKLHGTINSYGSIVATKSDYAGSQLRLLSNITGSILKLILTTKTVVYIGYAPKDPGFLFLQSFIDSGMNGLPKQSYVVTPNPTAEDMRRFEKLGIEPIKGDGAAFIQRAKSYVQETQHHLPDGFYDKVESLLYHVAAAHTQLYSELDMYEHPEIIICACYQDGLMHALQRILTLRKTGAYSCRRLNFSVQESYADLQKRFVREERYGDVAYVEGYKQAFFYGAVYELPEVDGRPSLFFTLGHDYPIDAFDEYKKLLKDMPRMHEGAYAWAKGVVRSSEDRRERGFVYHHLCRL